MAAAAAALLHAYTCAADMRGVKNERTEAPRCAEGIVYISSGCRCVCGEALRKSLLCLGHLGFSVFFFLVDNSTEIVSLSCERFFLCRDMFCDK